jgi:hypothetical protein
MTVEDVRALVAFERLTGEPEPDFAATGFEQAMGEMMRDRRGSGCFAVGPR